MHNSTSKHGDNDGKRSGEPSGHNPAEYNTPTTTPAPATATPGREIDPPPSQYPKPQPVAGKDASTDLPQSTADIDSAVNEASEDSFPASDPPSSHRTS